MNVAEPARRESIVEMGPLLQVPTTKPQWMHYGDMIRILGTIAVVIGHVSDMGLFIKRPATLTTEWWVCNAWDAASRWAVPVYIMLSGALLLDPARAETPPRFYQKRLMRIGIPLFFWSAFFMWFSVYYTGWVTPKGVWINLANGKPYMHMHFIFRIAGLYVFTPMMRVFLRNSSKAMQTGTVITLLALSSADSITNGFTGTELSAFARFGPFVGYYLAGYLLRNALVSKAMLAWCWVGLIGTIVALAVGTGVLIEHIVPVGQRINGYPAMEMILYDFLSPIRVVMGICAWIILVNLFHQPMGGPKIQYWLRGWANTTLGLYLIHPMFREMLYLGRFGLAGHPWTVQLSHGISAVWPPFVHHPNAWLGVPLVATMVYIPSLLVTIVLMKIPYVRRIAG